VAAVLTDLSEGEGRRGAAEYRIKVEINRQPEKEKKTTDNNQCCVQRLTNNERRRLVEDKRAEAGERRIPHRMKPDEKEQSMNRKTPPSMSEKRKIKSRSVDPMTTSTCNASRLRIAGILTVWSSH
jgi:hypothetical protein